MSTIIDESSCSVDYTSRDTNVSSDCMPLSLADINDDMINTTLNGVSSGKKQHDQCCHGDKDEEEVICHSNIDEMRDDVIEVVEPKKQTRGGASRLRQQWAKHTQPKLHVSDPECSREVTGEELLHGGVDNIIAERQQSDPTSSTPHTTRTPPPSCTQPIKKLMKTQSIGSISSESLTISSLWEAPSYDTIPDFLSSLGFDDFDGPELIPDRFIPPELDFVRPSLMRQATLGSVSVDDIELSPPSDGLMLGACADIITYQEEYNVQRDQPIPPQTLALYLPSNSLLPWQPASLETVIEETTSELLSPRPPSRQSSSHHTTPHIHSPLLSIDHTPTQEPPGYDGDISTGLLGAGIAQRFRQQLLTREDLRQRQASLGAESDTSSIYFSVGSHFEDGERDIEDSVLVKDGSIDETDNTCRRRRRGNYMPPPQILMWLEKTESHTVEDADVTDQPWPFSESSSPVHSPGVLPSITLNVNCNNNNEEVISERSSLPIIETGLLSLTKDRNYEILTDNLLTSAYHQASHTPT